MIKPIKYETLKLDKIVGGGQALGTLDDGRKTFVWGGLPDETVTIRVTKKKSHLVEGIVTEVHTKSPERIEPLDPTSYLSTSPWQIMTFEAEQRYKSMLIDDAFEMHGVNLSNPTEIYSDNRTSHYRNKMEYSWFGDTTPSGDTLDLAFFTRGGKGKYPIESSVLARPEITKLAIQIRDLLRTKPISARNLKTLLIRCSNTGGAVWQLYLKDSLPDVITAEDAAKLDAAGGEVIFSNPRSPASVITERLSRFGDTTLVDKILGLEFRYAAESFFQVNLPVYEQALRDMSQSIDDSPIVDLYSGVGSIGLSIGKNNSTILVEVNELAVKEMRENIKNIASDAEAILAPSEKALDYISSQATIIVDPPRAGLHADVTQQLLEVQPPRILYLSCNPVTQARDIALLSARYTISYHMGYNFFPRTPHIEHLVVLDKKA